MSVENALLKQTQLMERVLEKAGLIDPERKMHGGGISQKHTLSATSNQMGLPFNEDSFFFDCELDSLICNWTIQPKFSLLSVLPAIGTRVLDRKYGMLTEIDTTPTGTQPVEVCDDPEEIADDFNFCKLQFPLGRRDLRTKTGETDRLLAIACQRIFDDFMFLGSVRGVSVIPSDNQLGDSNLIIQGAIQKQLGIMTREHERWLMQRLWDGDPTNNTAGGGYKEFLGLNLLINDDIPGDPVVSTYLESQSGVLADCAAMNSDVKDFGGNCIGAVANDPNIWEVLQELEDTIWQRAFRMGYVPGGDSEWAIVMLSPLWTELTKVLPCQMAGDGCTGGTVNANDGGDGLFNLEMRQRMRETMTLTINGRTYPVILDDAIPYTQPLPTQYQSSIYFVPLRLSGEQVTFIEYLDYSQFRERVFGPIPGSNTNAEGWTDGGRFHLIVQALRRCFEVLSKMEPRLIFKATAVAGRIDNVIACPLQAKDLPFGP